MMRTVFIFCLLGVLTACQQRKPEQTYADRARYLYAQGVERPLRIQLHRRHQGLHRSKEQVSVQSVRGLGRIEGRRHVLRAG